MKLSIVLSTQPASFEALAYKGSIEKNITQIKELGYDGVELAVRNPKELDAEHLQRLLIEKSLPVPAIGTGQAYGEDGLSFTSSDPEIRKNAVGRIKEDITFAAGLNALVIIGLIRGSVKQNEDRETAKANLIDAMRECADFDKNTRFAIEPINRYETNLLNTVEETLEFIGELERPNVGLLLDTFHMNIEEPVIEESIQLAKEKIFHFHVADSNRRHPGAGHINFESVYSSLKKANYSGFVSAEILPLPDPESAAKNNFEFLKKIFSA